MACIFQPTDNDIKMWESRCIANIPDKDLYVQSLVKRFNFWTLYSIKNSEYIYKMKLQSEGRVDIAGLRVYPVEFLREENEERKVKAIVAIDDRFNLIPFKWYVSVLPEDLEECNLPGPDEKVGLLSSDPKQAAEYFLSDFREVHSHN
jgi:hypothetical protein